MRLRSLYRGLEKELKMPVPWFVMILSFFWTAFAIVRSAIAHSEGRVESSRWWISAGAYSAIVFVSLLGVEIVGASFDFVMKVWASARAIDEEAK